MNSILVILLGSLLGMLLTISAKSFYVQKSRKFELNFFEAFKVYTTKYTGPIFIGLIVIAIVMFVYPTIQANAIIPGDDNDIKYMKYFANFLKWLRPYSVGIGVVSIGLGFLIVRKGEKFLREAETEKAAAETTN
jgi:hypothetical protein